MGNQQWERLGAEGRDGGVGGGESDPVEVAVGGKPRGKAPQGRFKSLEARGPDQPPSSSQAVWGASPFPTPHSQRFLQ